MLELARYEARRRLRGTVALTVLLGLFALLMIGLFLAALSRGRRVRTVVLTGVVATSLATMAWFLLFGGTSLYFQHTGTVDVLATALVDPRAFKPGAAIVLRDALARWGVRV